MNFNFMDKDPKYANFKIGRYTYGSPHVFKWNHPNVTFEVGSFCSIADGVKILLGGNHHTEWVTTSPLNHFLMFDNSKGKHKFDQTGTKGSVIIGNDVWVGLNSTILSGVIIGDGSIIGSESVVAKSIPPYSIAVGNPSIVIKKKIF